MKKRLISYLRIYFTAIIILLSLVVVVWLCGCVVVRSCGRAGVWCGFCGCHFSFFSFRFLHIGTYRLPPSVCGQDYGHVGNPNLGRHHLFLPAPPLPSPDRGTPPEKDAARNGGEATTARRNIDQRICVCIQGNLSEKKLTRG